jgi:hypothetical protein
MAGAPPIFWKYVIVRLVSAIEGLLATSVPNGST